MALDLESVRQPFRRLQRALKSFPESPSPEEVHGLRTETRRLEAIVHALMLERRDGADLLKTLKPVRRAAGAVRDLDVLIGLTASFKNDFSDSAELHKQLTARRTKAAAELHAVISAQQEQALHALKRCSRLIKKEIGIAAGESTSQLSTRAVTQSLQLISELETWPKLTAENLHPYRLKVKQLRYTLQLGQDSHNAFGEGFLDALGKVKDGIGAWHDWSELAAIAEELLHHDPAPRLLQQIRSRVRQEFKKAITTTNAMRRRYLAGNTPRKDSRRPSQRHQAQGTPFAMRIATRLAS